MPTRKNSEMGQDSAGAPAEDVSDLSRELISELMQEAEATRRVLERVPEERLSWRPHPKSMSLGQLALHIAGLPGGIATLLRDTRVQTPVVPRPEARSVDEILTLLGESVRAAAKKLEEWGPAGLAAEWQMLRGSEIVLALPRSTMVRSIMLNHWYHHRGQLTVYLRLLDVPLPAVYGPTADEDPLA